MKLSDIMALVNAGYTKEEIAQMEEPGTSTPAPAPEPVKETAPTPEPVPAPVVEPPAVAQPVPAPQPAQPEAQPTMSELMQSIAKLTSAVQANAIAQSVIPGGANAQAPTAEDMLAEIIRPTLKERS